jgi:hypothetical protein
VAPQRIQFFAREVTSRESIFNKAEILFLKYTFPTTPLMTINNAIALMASSLEIGARWRERAKLRALDTDAEGKSIDVYPYARIELLNIATVGKQ